METGKINLLTVKQIEAAEVRLISAGDEGISIKKKEIPADTREGDELEVFIYTDNEGKVVATTSKPYAVLGECAYMKVIQETTIGAFLDWGIGKDLFVPFSRQKEPMREGNYYLTYVLFDKENNRLLGSTKLDEFISNEDLTVRENDEADIFICDTTPLGVKVIVNNKHWGLLYRNEIFRRIKKGDKTKGFIKKIREDGRLDVSLQEQGYDEVFSATLSILKKMKEEGGFLPLTDKSEPEVIYHMLQMSKKTFKKALGALYKERRVALEDKGIRLKKEK